MIFIWSITYLDLFQRQYIGFFKTAHFRTLGSSFIWRASGTEKIAMSVVGCVSLSYSLLLAERVLMVSARLVGPYIHGCLPGGTTSLITSAATILEWNAKIWILILSLVDFRGNCCCHSSLSFMLPSSQRRRASSDGLSSVLTAEVIVNTPSLHSLKWCRTSGNSEVTRPQYNVDDAFSSGFSFRQWLWRSSFLFYILLMTYLKW